MKLIFAFLLSLSVIYTLNETESKELNDLAKQLYEVEDKVDHLLFHFSHDVTRHEYQASPYGMFLAPSPKNTNSIHQKLKLIDHLNHQMGHPGALNTAANNAYNMGLGSPAMPIPRGLSRKNKGIL